MYTNTLLQCALLVGVAIAAPASQPQTTAAPLLAPNGGIKSKLSSIAAGLKTDAGDVSQALTAYAAVITDATVSGSKPTAVRDVIATQSACHAQNPASNIVEYAAQLIANGLAIKPNIGVVGQAVGATNSFINFNPAAPWGIYPKKNWADPSYTLAQWELQQAIYVPPGYTYGEKPPVLLIGGTGGTAGDDFAGNMIPLLTGVSYADPIWVNIPQHLLGDIQVSAEYLAYAINYVSAISKHRKPSLISWSLGGSVIQWTVKYWTSARNTASQAITASADFGGTVQAFFLCPGFPALPCDASVLQQERNSTWIETLRKTNGDSAYIPMTNVYSSLFDEIVQPQTGSQASAYLDDVRHVGVTNNDVQFICPGKAAGSFYTHEGVLFNPIFTGLAIDALQHGGPGQISRLDLATICNQYSADGLSLEDVLSTEADIVQSALNLLLDPLKVYNEPAIASYATY